MEDNFNNQIPQQENVVNDIPVTENNFFRKSTIIRIGIGLIGLLLISILIFTIVLPRLKPKAPEKVTLTYWGLWEDANVFSPIISDFTRQYPNVEVRYEKQDIKSLGKYIDRLSTRIQGGNGPDILRFHNSWMIQVRGLLLPLPSDVIATSGIDDKYFNVVKKDLNVNGAYYGIPLGVDTLSLFVNTDILKASGISGYPSTWDDLVKVSRQLTVVDEQGKIKTSGVALGTFDNIAHSPDILSMLLIQNGADFNDLMGTRKQNAIDALDFYASFAKSNGVWNDTLPNSKMAFAKGDLAMFFGYSWDIFEIKAMNPNLQFTVNPVPHLSGASQSGNQTVASYWVEGVSLKSKHPKEAMDFLKFLSKKETLEKLYTQEAKVRGFGEPYPRRDMMDLLKDNKYVFPFVQQADNSSSTLFSSDTFDSGVNAVLNAYLGNASRSILGTTSTETALETLSQGVTQVLSRYAR